ncbi:MAG: SDR family NAD(P)-dependent oxidoreductase [Myxococcota bacterium]
MELQDKTILITGASSGLGRAMATALAGRSNRFILTARRASLLEEVARELEALGSRCLVCPADATDPLAAAAVIDAGIAEFGPIDLAILNAGGGTPLNMAEAPVDAVIGIMRKNYETLVNSLCPMIAHMKDAGGVIAYTGSPAGFFGLPRSGPYSAAKAAGRVLFDSCRIELAGTKTRLVALYPGFALTDGINPDDVPVKSLIISKERAAREMIGAIERERAHTMFPKRIRFLMAFGRMLPEPVRRWILGRAAG